MFRQYTLILLILTSGAAFTEKLQAQRILGAVSLGMNLTQVDGDEFYGFHKVGLNVGPQVIIPFGKNKNWSASMELLYSQKGSRHNSSTDSLDYMLRLDYAEIPLLIHYTDKNRISGGVGFSYGRLINYRETNVNIDTLTHFFDSLYTYTTPLSDNEFAVIADVQVRVWSKLWAGIRYQYSMVKNRTVDVHDPFIYPRQTYTRYQYNNVISIRLTWVFNQAPVTGGRSKPQGGE